MLGFVNYSCLRPGHGKLFYRWRPQSYCLYQAFSSVRTALNEKCVVTKLDDLQRIYVLQKSRFSCLFSGRRTLRNFKKHNQISRLLKSRSYSGGNKGKPPSSFPLRSIAALLIAFGVLYLLEVRTILDWEEFVNDFLSRGEVEKIICLGETKVQVIVRNDAILPNRQLLPIRRYLLIVSDIKTFEDDLREVEDKLGIAAGDRIPVLVHHDTIGSILELLFIVGIMFMVLRGSLTFKMGSFGRMKISKFTLVDPFTRGTKGVKFSDVAGMKEAKQEIMEFVDYLKRPEHYKDLGAKVPKGALLLGPPGCGKTLLAKAVASEANVPFLSMNGSEFIELIGGMGAARVRDLFAEARKISPSIIYIDEIDAIGKKRAESGLRDTSISEAEHTLNQLLVEMDGMASREGVVTLASTNRADVLDKALLRPGRFDRHIIIDLPSAEERREIFMQYLKQIRLEHSPEHYDKRMASLTPGFSGADIANICNEAALHAARFKKKIVTGGDLEYAVDRVVGGTEKRSSSVTPEEKLLVAYHEAGRALIGWLSERGEILVKMSVVPRTHQSVGWTQFSQPEQYLYSQEELFDKMCMALGGRAAEALVFNKISTKSEKDLKKVTKIAYAQVRQYGMNNVLGPISFGATDEFDRKPYSKHLAALIDEEARKLVSKAFWEAEIILRSNKNLLVKLAQELMKRESMTYSDVEALIGPPRNSKKKMIEPLVFDLSIDMAAGVEPNSKQG